ncbi:ATP-binding cassette domain-containing protein [Candidatus Phytoplasma melaleucae]|uniref:ATP-binding cassette domain-containing protein n=1 Tax=Candidatus Phytoplasma melaleucae TaxID=2982630 RepID=A0ABT9DCU1_9MOLU|nr:ATP-binding cassette domain-containing protein ['Melaleuca sp.' phytoplasma]MDO8167928.1 ATP-binding cassette domain-containing protein ['Melaleuca sp.' phytoplasma]
MEWPQTLLRVENLSKFFQINKKICKANNNINLSIFARETLSIIGESGSGKSTLGKLIIQLQKAQEGKIIYYQNLKNALELNQLNKKEVKVLRQDLQIIFQNSFSALNPKFKIKDIIGEGLIIHKKVKNYKDPSYEEQISDIMSKCGLHLDLMKRFPHELSGGQRQRVNIAKTLILKPKFVICDEIVSALDVTMQKQILDLLNDLKNKYDITYLFISHDLGVAHYISDRIGVMYEGHLVELAPKEKIFSNPLHPYTKKLLNAIPRIDSYSFNINLNDKMFTNNHITFGTSSENLNFYEYTPGHFVLCTLENNKEIK